MAETTTPKPPRPSRCDFLMSPAKKKSKPRTVLKNAELRTELVAAERWAESAEQTARTAKAEFKKSRKAHRRAKKTAKEAWKEVKALRAALAEATKAAAPAKKKPASKVRARAGLNRNRSKVKNAPPVRDEPAAAANLTTSEGDVSPTALSAETSAGGSAAAPAAALPST